MLEFITVMFSRTACCSTRCYRFMAADPERRRGNQLIKTWRLNENFVAQQFTARYHRTGGSSADVHVCVCMRETQFRLVYTSVETCAPHEVLVCFWHHKSALWFGLLFFALLDVSIALAHGTKVACLNLGWKQQQQQLWIIMQSWFSQFGPRMNCWPSREM